MVSRPDADADAGETTATCSATSTSWLRLPRTAAALSRTEGTDCSRASVPFARGTRCGLRGCCEGDGSEMGSMSRSKMAEEEEWLRKENTLSTCQATTKGKETHTEVGEDGMDSGEREPRRWSVVRMCCDRCGARWPGVRLEVMCLRSMGSVSVETGEKRQWCVQEEEEERTRIRHRCC